MRLFLVSLLCFSLFLSGCTAPSADPLYYQSYPCTFDLHGEICGVSCTLAVTMDTAGRGTLSFFAPADLAGVQFIVHNLPGVAPEDADLQYAERGVTVTIGDLTIPLSEGAYPAGIYAVVQALSLSADLLTAAEIEDSNSVLTYTYPDGYVTLTTDSAGVPQKLQIDLYGTVSTLYIDNITPKEVAP